MNLKLSPLHILAFLILLFLVQQLHDWTHILTVRAICHCWGHRVFEGWTICGSASGGQHALISISGSLINFALLWVGWSLLHPEGTAEENSIGVALVFAARPLPDLIAAFRGGGELTESIAWIQQHGPTSNVHFVHRAGLVLILLLVIPPLVRAFLRLPGYKGKLIAFPLLLLLPEWIVRTWSRQLTHWFIGPDATLTSTYIAVGLWTVVLGIGCFLTARWLKGFIRELSL
ncbi:MAG TPA: hypothetical protein VN616_15745 [Puia sp.]|nr:hypothetical protein [Puia sp.]